MINNLYSHHPNNFSDGNYLENNDSRRLERGAKFWKAGMYQGRDVAPEVASLIRPAGRRCDAAKPFLDVTNGAFARIQAL